MTAHSRSKTTFLPLWYSSFTAITASLTYGTHRWNQGLIVGRGLRSGEEWLRSSPIWGLGALSPENLWNLTFRYEILVQVEIPDDWAYYGEVLPKHLIGFAQITQVALKANVRILNPKQQ